MFFSSRDATWNKDRTPLEFSGGRATNCASYERLKSTDLAESVTNQQVKSEYLICDVLSIVGKDLKPEAITLSDSYGEALASRLDLRSFPSSLGPRLDDDHYTLSRLFETSQLRREPWGVAVSSPAWSLILRVVLVGDIDHNGSIDWLIWLTDEALDGNYRGYDTLLIKDVAKNGLLRAQPL